jgi:hypothetical protein
VADAHPLGERPGSITLLDGPETLPLRFRHNVRDFSEVIDLTQVADLAVAAPIDLDSQALRLVPEAPSPTRVPHSGPIPLLGPTAPAGPAAPPVTRRGLQASRRATTWVRRYVSLLVALDAAAFAAAGLSALLLRFGPASVSSEELTHGGNYLLLLAAALPFWVAALAIRRAYDPAAIGNGAQEFHRVFNGALLFTTAFAVVCVAFNVQPARVAVAIALPLASMLTVALRYLARQLLHLKRRQGRALHRVLVVGDDVARITLQERLGRSAHHGLTVVGVTDSQVGADGEPTLAHVPRLLQQLGADTVAVAHTTGVSAAAVRRLSWALEGTGVDLLLAPALTDVAGERINVRPVSGLPLLQVSAPRFSGARRTVKQCQDTAGALLLLLVAGPRPGATATR